MAGKSKTDAAAQRQTIVTLLTQGLSIRSIAKALDCATRTVQTVKNNLKDANYDIDQDRREFNGRESQIDERTWGIITDLRQRTNYGPRMLWYVLRREYKKYGLELEAIPSPDTIMRYLRMKGMTRKLIGKLDSRGWPVDFDDDLGVVAIDSHGPMIWGSDNIFAVTIQDRHSRLSLAIPTLGRKQAMGQGAWTHAIHLAQKHIMQANGINLQTVFADNGEMGIANGHTKQAMRHALRLGARCVLNAPGKPWKNGRLENWHHRLDVEYFELMRQQNDREKKAGTRTRMMETSRIMDGFITWVNQYNIERPNQALKGKAPADLYDFIPYTPNDARIPDYEHLEPQEGIVDVIRLVWNSGRIELWGEDEMHIQEILGGQYVRIRFYCDPTSEEQLGKVIWQKSQDSQPIVVALFSHKMDRNRRKGEPFITAITFQEIDEQSPTSVLDEKALEVIKRQKLNEYQARKQYARVTKKKIRMNQEELPGLDQEKPVRRQRKPKAK